MPEVQDLVNYAILVAVVAGVLLMVTGKFLDLTVERQTSTQTRATINLLQKVVSEGDFLMTNSVGEKLKLMVDKTKLAATKLEDCCQSLQYDYVFSVGQFEGVAKSKKTIEIAAVSGPLTNYEGKLEYDRDSDCYYSFGVGRRSAADVPVNICEGDVNKCEQGVAQIETENSPLSELSYWITQACNFDQDLSKRIPLSTKDYISSNDVKIVGDSVCFKGACKKFSCHEGVEVKEDVEEGLLDNQITSFPARYCDIVRVVSIPPTEFVNNVRVIVYEGLKSVVEPKGTDFFLPADKDEWTETEESMGYYVTDRFFDVENNPLLIHDDAGYGEKSILIKSEDFKVGDESDAIVMHDDKVSLKMDKIPGISEYCSNDKKCVDIRGLRDSKKITMTRIHFKARTYSPDGSRPGFLRWQIWDDSGRCIEKRYDWGGGAWGGESRERVDGDWDDYWINLVDTSGYAECAGPLDLDAKKGIPSSFTWRITEIQWSACEGRPEEIDPVLRGACPVKPESLPGVSIIVNDKESLKSVRNTGAVSIRALAIDNFYFQGVITE